MKRLIAVLCLFSVLFLLPSCEDDMLPQDTTRAETDSSPEDSEEMTGQKNDYGKWDMFE